ncbi:LytR/AlgR family response regulator transcription factor [Sphingobacterium corticibacterium]|uniref:Response regulator transcription factor n=1 Tax=Sphingobacterium corticibacterium TaxID=2484746 RepID=A0A4V2DBF5_9SPHI|nr:LytTR family DNA-binding domain-containing protein [Sphingobacterium corticibacterium]RZF57446.1 response regulator transcription factor [Sphingobacterium corticibacterium]
MILNCIAIDDEPPALGLITSFVERTPVLNLLQSYDTSSGIIAKVTELDFHLLFLDIHMPGINGIEVARALKKMDRPFSPKIIFTTAYNQFAMESYQVEALDYLLKPFEYEDFLLSVDKAIKYFKSLPDFHAPELLQEDALFVRSGYQQIRVPWEEIKYIEGLKDYIKIHLKSSEKSIVALATLKSLSEKLPQDRFRRVQKSYIVALDAVTSLATNSLWIDGLEITIGKQYKDSLHPVFSGLIK